MCLCVRVLWFWSLGNGGAALFGERRARRFVYFEGAAQGVFGRGSSYQGVVKAVWELVLGREVLDRCKVFGVVGSGACLRRINNAEKPSTVAFGIESAGESVGPLLLNAGVVLERWFLSA